MNSRRETCGSDFSMLSGWFLSCVAVAAVNRPFLSRLEGDFAVGAAPGTGSFEHLLGSCAVGAGLPVAPALGTAFGLVLESFGLVEFLFTNGEGEGFAAFATC